MRNPSAVAAWIYMVVTAGEQSRERVPSQARLRPPLGPALIYTLAPCRVAIAALAIVVDERVRGHQQFGHLRTITALYGCGV